MILENNTLHLQNVRFSFPQVLVPKPFKAGDTPKYNCDSILNDAQMAEVMQVVSAVATEAFKDAAPQALQAITADKRLRCYGSGTERVDLKTGHVYDGYEGNYYLSGINVDKPQLFDQNNVAVVEQLALGQQESPKLRLATQPELANMFAGGNYGDVVVQIWAQNNQYGRAIRGQLIGLKYTRDGEHFGSLRPDAGAIFGAPTPAPAPAAAPVAPSSVAPVAPAPLPASAVYPPNMPTGAPAVPGTVPGVAPAPVPGVAPAPVPGAAPAPAAATPAIPGALPPGNPGWPQ